MIATLEPEKQEHPVYKRLAPDVMQALQEAGRSDQIEAWDRMRLSAIQLSQFNPFNLGHEPWIWKLADEQVEFLRAKFPSGVIHLLNLGGNRASKTERAAKRIMQLMVAKPGARVWCLHSTEAASKADQQPLIFKYIPPIWRPDTTGRNRKGRTTKIDFTDAGGFTKNTFVLPNGSQCWFKFYGADVTSLEGAEIDAAWADELIPTDWIEALRFRLVNRNGILTLTFTPAEHFSDTVKLYFENKVVIEETEAELLPIYDKFGDRVGHEKVPRVEQSGLEQARIVYFHTSDNPFGNYEGMKVEQRGQARERILMRVYGVPTDDAAAQFDFKDSIHRLTLKQFAEIKKKYPSGIRYHLVDPCSGRNWFMGWVYCPRPDISIWYREWPSFGHPKAYIEGIGDPGPWAILGGTAIHRDGGRAPCDGDAGPAQKPFRFGTERYYKEITEREAGETIFERWIDSRYGNTPITDREESKTLIQQMEERHKMLFCAMQAEKKILDVNDGSIDMINSALYYDKTKPIGEFSEELGRINEPRMYVVEDCPNIIWALKNWTGKDGLHGACKDPIDVIRGFVLSGLGYLGPEMFRQKNVAACY